MKLPRRHIGRGGIPACRWLHFRNKAVSRYCGQIKLHAQPIHNSRMHLCAHIHTPGVGLTYQKLFPLLAVPVRNPRAGAICATFNIFSISSFPAYVKNKNRPSALAEGRGIRHIIQLHIHQRHSMTNRHECIGYANKQPPAKHIRLHFQD